MECVAEALYQLPWFAKATGEPLLPPSPTIEVSHELRQAVFKRDRICRHCGTDKDLTADHIIPACRGGKATMENLQALCRFCNSSKGKKMPKSLA